jgi:hypothetical protein
VFFRDDNIGSGDANNVKIVDSSPKNFTIVNGQPTKNYDTIRPNEHKIHEYTIEPSGEGIFILDSATVTYEDNKENSYLSSSGPFTVKVGILGITLRFWEGDKWVEKYIPLEEQARPSPTPLQTPTPTMKETTIEPTSLDGNSASPPSTEKKMSPEVIAALIMGICAIIAAVISLFRLKNRKE